MSNGHGASRRQAYGRRQKDLRTRRRSELVIDLDGPGGWSRGADWGPRPAAEPLTLGREDLGTGGGLG